MAVLEGNGDAFGSHPFDTPIGVAAIQSDNTSLISDAAYYFSLALGRATAGMCLLFFCPYIFGCAIQQE